VTICVKDRICCLGEVIGNQVKLPPLGEIVKGCLEDIPKHFLDVELDEYVIMPNHVHLILFINHRNDVETQNFASLQAMNKFGPQSRNLGSIIRGFKAGVKKSATLNNIPFFWQSRFYDHVIRNEKSLETIRRYVQDNPFNWERDCNNVENLYI